MLHRLLSVLACAALPLATVASFGAAMAAGEADGHAEMAKDGDHDHMEMHADHDHMAKDGDHGHMEAHDDHGDMAMAEKPMHKHASPMDRVVARVGETEITMAHMVAMSSSLPEEQRVMAPQDFFNGVRERLIQQEAIAQTMAEIDTLIQAQIENERRSLLASEAINRLSAEIAVTAEDVQDAYDRRFANFEPNTEFNASHILVATEGEALMVIEELQAGADFADMARQKSRGPSGPNGGALGWFGPGRMVPAFEQAVVALENGEVSAPVRTDFGWHVIMLNDSRIPSVPKLDDIRAELQTEVWQMALRKRLGEIVGAAQIEDMDNSDIDPLILLDPSVLMQ